MNNEALQAVEDINFRISEKFNHKHPEYHLEYRSVGYSEVVTFRDFLLWSSQDDERDWDYEKNEYTESMEEFFIRKVVEIGKLTVEFSEIIKK